MLPVLRRRILDFVGRVWPQVRWQLAVSYLLASAVSVLVVVILSLSVGSILLWRSSVHLVERQLDLLVQSAGANAQALALDLASRAQSFLTAGQEAELSELLAGYPTAEGAVECKSVREGARQAASSNAFGESPDWLTQGSFQGVVTRLDRPEILAFARRSRGSCSASVTLRLPLDRRLAGLISAAVEFEVQPVDPGSLSKRRAERWPSPAEARSYPASRPSPAEQPGSRPRVDSGPRDPSPKDQESDEEKGWSPVVVVATDWQTGDAEDHVVLRARPVLSATLSQLVQFGSRRARWVEVMALLAASLVMVGIGSVLVAARITDRIIDAIRDLTHGADEVGRGNLSHRIPARKNDEMGALAQSFNAMAGSLEGLLHQTKEKERLEQEVRVARDVQRALCPHTLPKLPNTRFAALCQPARVVTGDLYDLIEVGYGRLGLLCADVSGKGVPAALLGANLQAIVRRCVGPANQGFPDGPWLLPSPSGLVGQFNAAMCEHTPDGRFATLFWADYDSATRRLRYSNAGHNPPILVLPDRADVIRLDQGGVPVGMFGDASYEQDEITLPPASLLVLYTDGVSEAASPSGEEFGDQRLIDLCRSHFRATPDVLATVVFDALRDWSAGTEQFDDMTVIVMKAQGVEGQGAREKDADTIVRESAPVGDVRE